MIAGYLKKRREGKYQGEFVYRLGEMLEQGFTLGNALEFLLMNFKQNDEAVIESIQSELSSGTPLNEVLLKLDFPSMICLQVYFAEMHGRVPETLKYAGAQWKKTEELKEKLSKLLQYPMFLLLILFTLLFLLHTFLMPRFEALYTALDFSPQGATAWLLSFLQIAPLISIASAVILITSSTVFALHFKRQNPQQKITLLMKIPILSSLFSLYFTNLFSKEVSHLLKSGFAVNEVFLILQQQTMHPMLKHVAYMMNNQLLLGHSVAEAVTVIDCFESQLAQLVKHGDASGRLAEELFIFSQFCETLIEEKVKTLLSILQPAIFLFVGVVVIAIYLSVMLPMFQMVGSI
ncbi:competence protein ComGB [Bacillus ectoiniformans]|nr:competence protein ComGB [Bacillus ectoiniformans]